ncbi:MAG: DNA cytosine methyltransferase [Actinomycetota bacterium]
MTRPTVIDAFCGAGGLSEGLAESGFETRLGFDLDGAAIETYRSNVGSHGIQLDVCETTASDLTRTARVEKGDLDLLAGGPPCQGFSKQKRGAHLGDRRNALVLEFLRLVEELEPKTFLMENVPMLAQVRGKKLVEQFSDLSSYRMHGDYYKAADFGVAQTRQRFVLVGVRKDLRSDFSVPSSKVDTWRTVKEAIGDLPEPPIDGSEHPDFANHYRTRPSAANLERISHVPPGGGWQDIPFELRLPCHQRVDTSRGGWPDVYGRLEWDGQCPTITGGFDSFSRGRFAHPESDRAITPREAARLQGFPDEYVFHGNKHEVRHQIGNAVPPPLAAALGQALARCLSID